MGLNDFYCWKQTIIISLMQIRKSKIQQQNSFYLKHNQVGQTKLVHQNEDFQYKANYRQVHNIEHQSKSHEGNSLYSDKEYQINLGTQFEEDDTVILRRLSTLYASANRPPFFNIQSDPYRPKNPKQIPHCLNELPLFSTLHYKSLFITQDYQKSGKYILVINNDGRFQVISVDDYIPIHKDTLQPIWGMSYKNPWELILIKAWAKKLKGYNYIPQTKPFQFIESFTNPTWKYFNIGRSFEDFLKKFTDFKKLKSAKIILKSKNKEEISEHGILAGSSSYELVGGSVQIKDNVRKYKLAIQGTTKTNWCGQLSYLDKNSIKAFHDINPELSFQRGFIMNGEDFFNNFTSAYVTSKRESGYFTGYKILDIAQGQKKAQHFQFYVPVDGFIDFSIKQFPDNAVNTAQSNIQGTSLSSNLRYLKNKYMLVKDNHFENPNQQGQFSYNYKPSASKANYSLINSNIDQSSSNNKFKNPRFSVYQIEYLKGYNKGEAHFISITKGRYILRLKSQFTNKPARYSINWVSSSKIQFAQANLSKQQKVELLHNSFVSIMHKQQHYSLQKGKKTQMISYGQTFEEIGYGFIAVKTTTQSPYCVLLQVNPSKLAQQGYLLKGRYKQEKEPFHIYIPPGQFDSVVLKLNKKANQYVWPTQAFKIWKKDAPLQSQIAQQNKEQQEQKFNPNLLHSQTYKINTGNKQKKSSIVNVEIDEEQKPPKQQPKKEKVVDQWQEQAQI